MTASELQDLLVTNLIRHRGGSRRHWRMLVGPVRLYDIATHAHCNWAVDPSGDAAENSAIEQLLDTVSLTHPIVVAG